MKKEIQKSIPENQPSPSAKAMEDKQDKLFGAREKFIVSFVLLIALGYVAFLYITNPDAQTVQLFLPIIALFLGAFCAIMPCCLPVIPGYLGILGKLGAKVSPTKIFLTFFAGLISIIIVIGLVASMIGLGTATVMWIKWIAGGVILLIGVDLLLSSLGIRSFNLMMRMPGLSLTSKSGSLFTQGIIYGSASSPCALLILTPILVFSLTVDNFLLNFSNFILYGLGRAVPYLVITYMTEWKRKQIFGYLAQKGKTVHIVLALLIIVAALGVFSEAIIEDPLHHLFQWSSPFHN